MPLRLQDPRYLCSLFLCLRSRRGRSPAEEEGRKSRGKIRGKSHGETNLKTKDLTKKLLNTCPNNLYYICTHSLRAGWLSFRKHLNTCLTLCAIAFSYGLLHLAAAFEFRGPSCNYAIHLFLANSNSYGAAIEVLQRSRAPVSRNNSGVLGHWRLALLKQEIYGT